MGGSKEYLPDGGFSEYNYSQRGITNSGIKILQTEDQKSPKRMPSYSNTPNTMYAKTEGRTKTVKQVVVYGGGSDKRQITKHIDIGHEHTNQGSKKTFTKDMIHVHDFYLDNKGHIKRKTKVRKPSRKERRIIMIARYGGASWNE